MSETIYSISIRWIDTKVNIKSIESVLDEFGDWYRYNSFQWFVASEHNQAKIFDALRPLLSTNDTVLVVKVDLNKHRGYVPADFVAWIKRYLEQA